MLSNFCGFNIGTGEAHAIAKSLTLSKKPAVHFFSSHRCNVANQVMSHHQFHSKSIAKTIPKKMFYFRRKFRSQTFDNMDR